MSENAGIDGPVKSEPIAAQLADFHRALIDAGFTRKEALRIVVAWSSRPIFNAPPQRPPR